MFIPKRIAVIGNGGGGKSTLAAALARHYALPWHEVDRIQYGPNWTVQPADVVRHEIREIIAQGEWVLDGFGPYDTIQERFVAADQIVFVDHPLWVHYWWAMERQIAAHLGLKRFGGRDDCDLRDVNRKMCEALWRVHNEIRPKIVEDLKAFGAKVIKITSPEQLDAFAAMLGGDEAE